MQETEIVHTVHLFPRLEAKLVELLRGLSAADWQKPTICSKWCVKDIAAHLLDGNLRKLSIGRDGYYGENPGEINSYRELVDFLNRLNSDWVKAAKRISPKILVALIELTSKQVHEYYQSLDLMANATFSVAWAGEEQSANWFDIAREYTERWHHQQQIRLAVNRPGIMDRELYFPVLDTFMRALPHVYKEITAAEGAGIHLQISGDAGRSWYLRRSRGSWNLSKSFSGTAAATVTIPQEIAWRVFTKGIEPAQTEKQVVIEGDAALAHHILKMVCVMA